MDLQVKTNLKLHYNMLNYIDNLRLCFNRIISLIHRKFIFGKTLFSIKNNEISMVSDLNKNSYEINESDNNYYQKIDVDKTYKNCYPSFSVAMCVYKKDNPEWFDEALHSIINQTIIPNEIILIVDGPIPPSVQEVVDKYTEICSEGKLGKTMLAKPIDFIVVYLSVNHGLGNALNIAVKRCQHEIIARMDSDDISVRNRFEQQLRCLMKYPDIDILGGQIQEFIGDVSNIVGMRKVPLTDFNCKNYLKKRCPFNHMTVMFKKSAVLKAGNYKDWFFNEDYYLWIRMALNHSVFANLSDTLVYVRVGKEMYQRRGGQSYFISERNIQKLMFQNGLISAPRYIINVFQRLILQVLIPSRLRGWILRTFAREREA